MILFRSGFASRPEKGIWRRLNNLLAVPELSLGYRRGWPSQVAPPPLLLARDPSRSHNGDARGAPRSHSAPSRILALGRSASTNVISRARRRIPLWIRRFVRSSRCRLLNVGQRYDYDADKDHMAREAQPQARELSQRPPSAPLPDDEFAAWVAQHCSNGSPSAEVADVAFHENCHRFRRLDAELQSAVKAAAEESLIADARAWQREGGAADRAGELEGRELRLAALVETHPDLRAAIKKAAHAHDLAVAQARGIPVRHVRRDENVWTGERSFSILRNRTTLLGVRRRGARQQRASGTRIRGSRRCATRALSRAGPDDPDGEHEPELGPTRPFAGSGR